MARIRVYKDGVETQFPVTCTSCGECIDACPEEAISEENGIIDVDLDKCIACGTCVETCNYNAIRLSLETSDSEGKAFKCDLCGGSPECVKVCLVEAIKFEDIPAERKEMIIKFLSELESSYASEGGD
jgi:Fe-S-cluster-containing hydrogenase component 2